MIKHTFFINGEKTISKNLKEIINPYDNSVFSQVYFGEKSHLKEAEASVFAAFEVTKKMSSMEKIMILERTSELILKTKEELANTVMNEAGKPICLAKEEVERCALVFKLAAGIIPNIEGSFIPLDITPKSQNKFGVIGNFPVGPILAITPFNFPLNLVSHKIAPAIASGNPFILKPSSKTPVSSILLGEILIEAGYPRECLNIIPFESNLADILIESDAIKLITFTGSPTIGWDIKRKAPKKKVLLELGGNGAVIIHHDCDFIKAAKKAVLGGFVYAGQVCISVQRVYIHKKIYTKVKKAMIEATEALKIKNITNPETIVGPMIDENESKRIENWVDDAKENNAIILTGGKREGNFYYPTLIENCNENDKLNSQEAFGPIIVLHPYENFEDAVNQVNNSIFGLQAGVYTNSWDLINYSFQNINTGAVIINDIPTFRVDHMPYGGIKDSGFGREGLKYAITEMTEPKLLVLSN